MTPGEAASGLVDVHPSDRLAPAISSTGRRERVVTRLPRDFDFRRERGEWQMVRRQGDSQVLKQQCGPPVGRALTASRRSKRRSAVRARPGQARTFRVQQPRGALHHGRRRTHAEADRGPVHSPGRRGAGQVVGRDVVPDQLAHLAVPVLGGLPVGHGRLSFAQSRLMLKGGRVAAC